MEITDEDRRAASDTARLDQAPENLRRASRAPGSDVPSSTLRLQVFSDLHLDFNEDGAPRLAEGADVVVVAGDTCEDPGRGFEALRRKIPSSVPLVCVLGNHEYYRGFHSERVVAAREAAPEFRVSFLENETVRIQDVRFVGATLWTDYALFGDELRPSAMRSARGDMADHRRVSWARSPWKRFRPEEALRLHLDSSAFIEEILATGHDGPTVVVTHHAPLPASLDRRRGSDPLDPAYASDLSGVILAGQPALWVHGHVHTRADYRIGATRVVCNPRGYGTENPLFEPSLVLEVKR